MLKWWLVFRRNFQYGTSHMTLDTYGLISNYTMMFGQHSPIFRFLQSEMAYLLETHSIIHEHLILNEAAGHPKHPQGAESCHSGSLGHQAVLGWQLAALSNAPAGAGVL